MKTRVAAALFVVVLIAVGVLAGRSLAGTSGLDRLDGVWEFVPETDADREMMAAMGIVTIDIDAVSATMTQTLGTEIQIVEIAIVEETEEKIVISRDDGQGNMVVRFPADDVLSFNLVRTDGRDRAQKYERIQ